MRCILAGVMCVAVSGCAQLMVVPVGDLPGQTLDAEARGIRFYRQAPFLLVRSDGQGGLVTEVKWLPDTTQMMSARPFAILAKYETTLEFDGGALTKSSLVVDETAVVNASLQALGKVLAAQAANLLPEPGKGTVPGPRLYRIVIDGDVVKLQGGAALDENGQSVEIHVNVSDAGT
jgi:hypothetical protein